MGRGLKRKNTELSNEVKANFAERMLGGPLDFPG
jgi:hypothetical protein